MKVNFITTISILMLFSAQLGAQCLTDEYGQYPETYLPVVCDGSTQQVIAEDCWTAEYSMVALIAGTTYTFSSSIPTDLVTISDELGTAAVAFATGTVNYTPTVTGLYRFYLHNSAACDGIDEDRSRIIVCNGDVTEGCLTGTLYPASTFIPTVCDGQTENSIAIDCFAGQYSNVSLIGSTQYAFVSSVETDFITIGDASGTNALAFGFGAVFYNPLVNETIRFYTHTNFSCGTENVDRSRSVYCFGSTTGLAGPCVFGDLWPTDPFTPACTGTSEEIATDCYAGEYSMVMLEANKEYEFSTIPASDWITLTSEDATTVIAYGEGPISYTTGASAVSIRFYSHLDSLCGSEEIDRKRLVACEGSSSSIVDLESSNFKLFPNPATNKIAIESTLTFDAIEVVSIDGRVLISMDPSSTVKEIDVHELSKGTYFMRTHFEGKIATKEFIKN